MTVGFPGDFIVKDFISFHFMPIICDKQLKKHAKQLKTH